MICIDTRTTGCFTYNWLFNDRWFVQGQLAYESDPLIDLESRVILSAGLGRDIWNTPRRFLSVQLGAGFQKEQFDQEFEESAVAAWSLRYRQDFLRDDLELFHNHSITHNVTGRTNTSYKTSTGVKFEMTDLFYAKLSADYDFESEPSDTSAKQDTTIVIGVGAEF
jgi:putative salt-induced outer membrane protein YdiY